jgi:hypothetical protein
MSAAAYNTAKQNLKAQICDYFTKQGVGREVLRKVAVSIKADAESGYYHTLSKLAPRHHAITTQFIDELCRIESERSDELYRESLADPEYQRQLGRDEILAHDMGWNHGC